MNKKYWLRGLVTGIISYALFLLVFVGYAKEAAVYVLPTVALYISPTIPLGLFVGWMYGKMPKVAIFLSFIMIILLIGLEMLIFKNTFYPKPYATPYPIQNGQPYTPQPSIIPGSQYKVN